MDAIRVTDIAIVGLALRVPGARDAQQFWQNLRDGIESIETRTTEQLLAAGESAANLARKHYVPRTAILPDMDRFDADFFGMSPKDAAIMDPQHRQFLECAWEALEDATLTPEGTEGPIGVFAGCGMGSYFYFNVCSHRRLLDNVGMFLLRHTGNDKDFLATRASFAFNLTGPSVNIQTACSTSLVAVHYACQSLLNGECDAALAGGVTIELPHGRGYFYQDGEILSPDGHCRPFDHRAAGTVFGSGVGVVVLKRLADAVTDGDPVRAVIRATAVNNDGASKAGYLAPSVKGQSSAIVEALSLADVNPETIQYVECHGTGTYLGDPIEVAALTEAFRCSTDAKGYCRIGSVKSNIGHLDTAAGVVSLIKTVLSMEHGKIPPTLGFERANPSIDFDSSPFVVNDRLTDWPASEYPRRAVVNSLGVGGTNAFLILEEPPQRVEGSSAEALRDHQLFMLSAVSGDALDDAGCAIAEHLESRPDVALEDVAATLAFGRRRFQQHRVVAAVDRTEAIAALRDPRHALSFNQSSIESPSGVAFLFPGGGAQHPGMAASLYATEAAFRDAVDEGLSYLPRAAAAEILSVWMATDGDGEARQKAFRDPALQLPAILITEVALARIWSTYGIRPAALIGHSMGEYAAACVSGVMDFETAVGLVELRGRLFNEVSGGMLSVPLSEAELKSRLPKTIDIASVNAPELCVVSGPSEELEAFRRTLGAQEVESSTIPINVAAHSRYLAPILDRFHAYIATRRLNLPSIPIASNLSGDWLTEEEACDPNYWVRHLSSAVRFADGLALLASDENRVFLEVGPGRGLATLTKAQGTIAAHRIINSLPHPDDTVDDRLHFLAAFGRLAVAGVDVAPEQLKQLASGVRIHLPTYRFRDQRYFIEPDTTSSSEQRATALKIPELRNWGWVPAWKPAYPDMRSGGERGGQKFLVFLDDTGLGRDLVKRLRAAGHAVSIVELGDGFVAHDDGSFRLCPELGRDGYESLFARLAQQDRLPDHIIHGWLLTADEHFRPGSSFFHRNQERGFYSLMHIAQALSGVTLSSDLQITVLVNGLMRVAEERVPYPDKATALGPAQVLSREMPEAHVRVVDVLERAIEHGSDSSPLSKLLTTLLLRDGDRSGDILERVWEDVFAEAADEIVAYRGNRRWVLEHHPMPLADSDAGLAELREEGVYLVTGGLGDIAMALTEQLARRLRARFLLTGRSRLPDAASWDRYLATYGETDKIGRSIAAIRRIEAAGGKVIYRHADVANLEDMRAVMALAKERFGRIDGVFHAAGIVRDELMALKRPADVEDVLTPKVQGTMVLAEALKGTGAELLVLFSSTSTTTAPAGQADYVAANAYLNAFADASASGAADGEPVLKVRAINWGVWSEIGLAARAIENGGSASAQHTVEPSSKPLFDRRMRDDASLDCLEMKVSPERTWLLDEHRLLSGEAIWPGTGYLEMFLEAAGEFGIPGAIEVSDLAFIRPLHVADGVARTVCVQLNRRPGRLMLNVLSRGDADEDWVHHAEGGVAALRERAPAPLKVAEIRSRCSHAIKEATSEALRTAQERHLRFGPRWSVLRGSAYGENEAIADLSLAPEYADEVSYGLLAHPALLDIATGYAMELIPGYDPAQGLWVPAGYGRVKLFAPIPAKIVSYVRLGSETDCDQGVATFDITIAAPDGTIVAEISEFMVRRLFEEISLAGAGGLAPAASASRRESDHGAAGELSPALVRLSEQVSQGITPGEGCEALLGALGTHARKVIVSSLDLDALKAGVSQSDEPSREDAVFARPQLDTDFVAPETEVQRTLAGFWSDLLGVPEIGVNDNFFDLGGHSLLAVRLFRMIRKSFGVDLPISTLIQAPTIGECALLIEEIRGNGASEQGDGPEAGTKRQGASKPRTHLVEMSPGRDVGATPLFICAGMFGNILNLRHLAMLLGDSRPVYGLQARGLYGDTRPHETFEEMARANLAEMREVQPSGPYLLAGFSGGGLVAYEMAQQLRDSGDEAAIVVMLDTPFPEEVHLSATDRLQIKMQHFWECSASSIWTWAHNRYAWEMKRWNGPAETEVNDASQFRNAEIEAAFRRALVSYDARPYEGEVKLFRPQLRARYHLRDGRSLNEDRGIVRPDNGWSPYLRNLEVIEVPGDHDSMVLVPSVQILANRMRSVLRAAEQKESGFSIREAAE